MNNIFPTVTSIFFVASSTIISLPTLANPSDRVPTIFSTSNLENSKNLPASTTVQNILVATVSNNIQIDIGKNKPQRIDLILAQPFNNFPAGSHLRAIILPTEDGNAILNADMLYGNNGVLQINANSELLYGQTVTVSDRSQEALKRTTVTAPIGGLIGTALGEDVEDIIQYTAIFGSVGATTGLLSPQKIQLLNLSAGTPILFTLNKSEN